MPAPPDPVHVERLVLRVPAASASQARRDAMQALEAAADQLPDAGGPSRHLARLEVRVAGGGAGRTGDGIAAALARSLR